MGDDFWGFDRGGFVIILFDLCNDIKMKCK